MQHVAVNPSIGCLAILPAALVGFAGLADGAGPQGWRGFAEMFGWFVACLVFARFLALLLARTGRHGVPAYGVALAIVVGIGVLAYKLFDWLGLDAPMAAKATFTSSMQAVGAIGALLCALLIARAVWMDSRR